METNIEQQGTKKEISGFSIFEMILSGSILFTLFTPLVKISSGISIEGIEIGNAIIWSIFDMATEESGDWFYWVTIILPFANIIAKFFHRTSWLSALTLLSAIAPVMITEDLGEPMLYQVELVRDVTPLAWINFIGMAISVAVSWIIFWGRKCKNYKRLFLISGIILVSSFGFMYLSIALDLIEFVMISGSILFPLGVFILIIAIASVCFNYKKREPDKEDSEEQPVPIKEETLTKHKTGKGNKKFLISSISCIAVVLLLILGFFMFGSKQVEFEAKLPVWQKFIIVEKSDVNLRQSPDANSQKLMEEEGAMDSYLIWADEPKGSDSGERKPYRLDNSSVCPVLAETGDWYEILVQIGDKYNLSTKKAYIMKKFCKEVKPIPINNSRFYKIPDGKFKNKYLEYDYGGVYAEPSSLTMGWDVDGGYIFPEAFKHSFENNGSSERFVFNILTEDRLEQWFGKITEETVGAYHLYYNFAEAGLQLYYIEPYDYPGEMSK